MKIRRILLISVTILFVHPAYAQFSVLNDSAPKSFMNAKQALQQMQGRADQAFAEQNYQRAFQFYNKLNKIGDNYSQFRLATMYEDGLYVEPDIIEAYAWSYLAAEVGRKAYMDYHLQIKSKLTAGQLPLARQRASELIKKYGVFVSLVRTQDLLRESLKNCTGSKVGNRCDAVSMQSFNCSSANELEGNLDCLRIGSLGLASIAVSPVDIRMLQRSLRDYIDQYQPGRIELGDFELIKN
ncbi:MAG: hypothetical protein PF630_04365 [Gammaproteobacteria bacterium]|jgi:hypothetical protein|nr:hypothetical protein [Gammaproteobacteria bacterium]